MRSVYWLKSPGSLTWTVSVLPVVETLVTWMPVIRSPPAIRTLPSPIPAGGGGLMNETTRTSWRRLGEGASWSRTSR